MGRLTAALRDRRRRQAGTTLIELLVSVTIMGLALTVIIGAFSTGLLNATLAKRNTAVQGVIQYEIESISSSQFNSTPQGYSDCFATENTNAPTPASGGSCPTGYTLRADVTVGPGLTSTSQQWTVTVVSLSAGGQIGSPVSLYKVSR
jgi:type II secretory pathway pseudopilin PulG